MTCPHCGGPNFRRPSGKLGNVMTRNEGTFRRHVCQDCRHVFLSIQQVVSPRQAERLLMTLEEGVDGRA